MEKFSQMIIHSLQSVFEKVLGIIPNLMGATFVFIIGWLIVRFSTKLLTRLLEKPTIAQSLDKLVDGLGMGNKINPSHTIGKIISTFFMLIVLLTATDVLGVDILSQLLSQLVQYIPKLLSAIVMFVVGLYGAGLIRNIVSVGLQSMGVKPWRMMGNIVFYFLAIAISISALGQAGIDTQLITINITIIVAGIMLAFAVAYGFAARNVLSGILTSFYHKNYFKIGEVIEIDGEKGTVIAIDTVSITLDTGDSKAIVPLYKLLNEKIVVYK